ncbi:MAG: zinc-ribbon domain-containing protein [Clostridia bacterium]|nr:zinc-ribbon domain-containing protein [Clostridia bacterium]
MAEKTYVSNNAQLMAEWDWEKNADFDPTKITCGSGKKVWWKCPRGHSYQKIVYKKVSRAKSCPVCSGHKTVAGVNDFATHYPELAEEWHPTKNGELTPFAISQKNGRKVWWKCQLGHEWQATPRDRVTDHTGCPYCKSRLLTSFPEQAVYYYVKKIHPDAINRYKEVFNNGMELDIYIPTLRIGIEYDGANWHRTEDAHRKEREKYSICQKENIKLFRIKEHSVHWDDVADTIFYIDNRRNIKELSVIIQTIIDSLDPDSNMWTRQNPYQLHSRFVVDLERDGNEIREFLTAIPNSIADLRPDLVEEWHPTLNGKLTPNMFSVNSNDCAWWQCKTCGHEWRTIIISRGSKKNSGCPECSKIRRGKTFTQSKVAERGSLAENNPSLAAEWHPTRNGDLKPTDITEKRFKNVWWLCPTCNYEWEASPNNRSKGVGCPCCSGRVPKIGVNDFQTLFPEISKEWNYEKNNGLQPYQFLPKSGKKMWWKCSACGNEWETIIRNRANGHGCPKCAHKKKNL